MLNFENIEHLVSHMFDKLNELDNYTPVTVVADDRLTAEILKEILEYKDINIGICDIDSYEYDREYLISLDYEDDSECWNVSVKKAYNYEKELYFSTGGYVLFHEDVNSKALVDMQNNDYVPLEEYDWFVIDEDTESEDDDETDEDEPDEDCESEHNYMINGESITKEEFDVYVSRFKGTDKDNSDSNNKEYHITIKGNLDMSDADRIINHMENRMADMMKEFYRPFPLRFYW